MPFEHQQGPAPVIPYFQAGFHTGRGPQLDDVVTDGILLDLLAETPAIKAAAEAGEICYTKRLTTGPIERNVDLILGPTARSMVSRPPSPIGVVQANPADVWLGVEVKSMMTEHHKAQRNRRVELNAHGLNMHAVNPKAVRAGICIINASDRYKSHTSTKEFNDHGDGKARARSAIAELSNIPIRTSIDQTAGLDAMCTSVVVVDNINFASSRWLQAPPARPDGDVMAYGRFIRRIADLLQDRFLRVP